MREDAIICKNTTKNQQFRRNATFGSFLIDSRTRLQHNAFALTEYLTIFAI